MKLWEHPTRSLQSLQRSKASISIMSIQQSNKSCTTQSLTPLAILSFLLHKGHKLLLLNYGVAAKASRIVSLTWE